MFPSLAIILTIIVWRLIIFWSLALSNQNLIFQATTLPIQGLEMGAELSVSVKKSVFSIYFEYFFNVNVSFHFYLFLNKIVI